MSKRLKRITITLAVLIGLWLVASYTLFIVSPKIIFKTGKSKNVEYPVQAIQEFKKNKAGDSLDILWLPNDTAKITYLYFHGNIGRLTKVIDNIYPFGNVCSPAYPGYSRSTGQPSTENIYEMVDIAINFLREKNIDLKNVIVLGHSLGGSPAMYAAVQYPELKKVITINTFYSMTKMCEDKYKILCIFSGSILNTGSLAPNAKAPVLICHTPNDSIIPYAQGEMLFNVVGSTQKGFRKISGTHGEFNMTEVLK
ncbi:MAG: dienelactone hydrolase family protein [Bacteroidetes bacterium]|nr:dienelactone hydrolase family protein [Bacteroidota bacterium]